MCGIAGIALGPGSSVSHRYRLAADLAALADGLAHRGPDTRGTETAGDVGLAHTRLAILDLSPQGAQPMWSPDRRFVFAYNGEVYNFARIRSELEKQGERFESSGDTQVVLRLLAREGAAGLARLDGMFALALYDTESRELLLARDRTGQKPLYLAERAGGGWVFASELRPLLGVAGVDTTLSPEGLSMLLSFGYLPSPHTLRRSVRQLEPGSYMRLRPGQAPEVGRYVEPHGPRRPLRDADGASHELEALLSQSVKDHLVSDVPLGVFLSGGVDSSVVAALAARHVSRVKTFCVVHGDPAYDERKAARAVADAIGSDHHEVEFSDSPLSEDELDVIVDHHGDPFVDSSSLAVYRLSREMKRHVTVALSGDGADEVFAGYPRFGELRQVSRLARLPDPLLAFGEASASRFRGTLPRRVARAFRIAAMPSLRRSVALTSLFWPAEQSELLQPEWSRSASEAEAALDDFLASRGCDDCRDPVEAAHWIEQSLILPDDMLVKVDRMSMTVALEVRPPVLGNDVLDFAASLPFHAKHRGRAGKLVLKQVARRLVPPWVVDRPKMGFAVPLELHGGAVLEEATRFALESEASPLRRLFRPQALDDLAGSLRRQGEGRDPEDSPYRRVHRRWLLALLARTLDRHGGV